MRFTILVFVLVIHAGCASQIGSSDMPDRSASIVFGSIANYGQSGVGFTLKNSDTDESYTLSKVKGLFAKKLPKGRYTLLNLGIRGGISMACNQSESISFVIPGNRLVYLGSLFSNIKSDLFYYNLKSLNQKNIRKTYKYCKVSEWTGFPNTGQAYKLSSYNNIEMDKANLNKNFPQLKNLQILNLLGK